MHNFEECWKKGPDRKQAMWIQIGQRAEIENPRKYRAFEVEHLRHLLTAGSRAERDPNRNHFYDLEHNGDTYYIHISPISGNVVLLAKWIGRCRHWLLAQGKQTPEPLRTPSCC